MSKTPLLQRQMPVDFELESTPAPVRKRSSWNKFIDAAIVAGILGIGVGAVDKGYIGTAVVHNADGSTSVGVRYPNVPATTDPLPKLDALDRTTEVGILRRAARINAWCSGPAISDKDTENAVCAKESTILWDPKFPNRVTADLRTDPESASSPGTIYVSFANNKAACTGAISGVQQSYHNSVQAQGFDPSSAPELRLVIDRTVEGLAPGLGCDDLCVPISTCVQTVQVPGTTEATHG